MLNVCFVCLEGLPVLAREFGGHSIGGEEVQHTLLARALAARGHAVSMVVADYGQPEAARWQGVRTRKAYRLDAGWPVVRFVHPRWTGVWRALRRADADVYYVSCAGMLVGLVALFCRLHRRRLVFRTAHDRDCQPDRLLIRYARDRKLYEYGIRSADAILTQSVTQQSELMANYGLASTVASMMVDGPRAILPRDRRDYDVLWVNNLAPIKRPDLILELARRMPKRRFAMIGGSRRGFLELFEQSKAEAAALPNLEFLGRVPYHDVNPYYERCRLFVNTSDSEGFPNSYLQAWVRGTPVVAFFDPDGAIAREGLGAAPGTLPEMIECVDRLLDDAGAWAAASDRARAFMARHFDDDLVLAPYLAALSGPSVPGTRRAAVSA